MGIEVVRISCDVSSYDNERLLGETPVTMKVRPGAVRVIGPGRT